MKRENAYGEPGAKHSRIVPTHVFKILGHHTMVGAILGKGGGMIKTLHEETGCEISAARKTDLYCDTSFRLVHIGADAKDKLQAAIFQIADLIPQLAEVATSEAVRVDCIGPNPGDFKINFVLPQNVSARIIGKGGANIKEIRATSGCNFTIDKNLSYYGAIPDYICEIVGPMDGIRGIISSILDALEADMSASWYRQWAAHKDTRVGGGEQQQQLRPIPQIDTRDRRVYDDRGRVHNGRERRQNSNYGPVSSLRDAVDRIELVDAELEVETSTRVPSKLAGCIIGPKGSEIKRMKDTTGASIDISEQTQDLEREVVVKGTPLQVCTAMLTIWEKLRDKTVEMEDQRMSQEEEDIKRQMAELKHQLKNVQRGRA